MLDIGLYRHYLEQYVRQAIENSDRTTRGIAAQLHEISPPGRLSRHKPEKRAALMEATKAFDNNRHWPVDIVLSHLGLDARVLLAPKESPPET